MKLSTTRHWLYWVALTALLAVLVTLAAMQYRWSREIAKASSVQMRANLQTSIARFREDLHRELSSIALVFDENSATTEQARLATTSQRFQRWTRNSSHPQLVSAVYLWDGDAGKNSVLKLEKEAWSFRAAEWPRDLASVHEFLDSLNVEIANFPPPWRDGRGFRDGRPRPPGADMGKGRFKPHRPGWFIDEDTNALFGRIGGFEPGSPNVWAIVVLNRDVLRSHVLKELADRHFGGTGGLEYRVAIIEGENPSQFVFTTDQRIADEKKFVPDETANLFGPFGGPGGNPAFGQGHGPSASANGPDQHNSVPGMVRFEPLKDGQRTRGWQLMAQHRQGSLEAAVKTLERQHLALSLGVLAVLAITTGMLFIVSERAHTLAQLQMDFVAAVSHELRTPLTVISSAAENIADGIVENPKQVARYGRVIKGQTRQLIELVEQILVFVSTRQKRAQYHLREIDIKEAVETALRSSKETIEAAGFRVEYECESNLPLIEADAIGLARVLQNLISNAVKYGGDAKWIGVKVERGTGARRCIQIKVSDGGIGIEPKELSRVFEPFYRSDSVTAAQIRGTGLGLAVARSITEAMGGTLMAKSEPGNGSTFTLSLLCSERTPAEPTAVPSEVVRS